MMGKRPEYTAFMKMYDASWVMCFAFFCVECGAKKKEGKNAVI